MRSYFNRLGRTSLGRTAATSVSPGAASLGLPSAFRTDVIDPVSQHIFERENGNDNWSPEKELYRVSLIDAATDLHRKCTGHKECHHCRAQRWFAGDSGPISFADCCAIFNLAASAVLRAVAAAKPNSRYMSKGNNTFRMRRKRSWKKGSRKIYF